MNIKTILQNPSMPYYRETVVDLLYTAHLVTDKVSEVLKPYSISIQQFNVLRILRGQKMTPVTLHTIQQRMIHRMSNTTRLVDKLVTKELVCRKVCVQNRRKVDITITKKGLRLLEKIDIVMNTIEKKIIRNLSEEDHIKLHALLEKIRA